MSIGLYVSRSVGQYVRMQLFSLGIKMKVVHNVIRMSDSRKILVRKSLRTAKDPALVWYKWVVEYDGVDMYDGA